MLFLFNQPVSFEFQFEELRILFRELPIMDIPRTPRDELVKKHGYQAFDDNE